MKQRWAKRELIVVSDPLKDSVDPVHSSSE